MVSAVLTFRAYGTVRFARGSFALLRMTKLAGAHRAQSRGQGTVSDHCGSRLLVEPDVLDRIIGARRLVDVALDVRLHRLVLVRDEEVDPGQVLEQDVLNLLINPRPRLLVRLLHALGDQLIDLRIAVADAVVGL